MKPFTAKRPRVEMVPLIDMFFLLLVFFIFGVFSLTMQQGILVELPEAATAAATRNEALTVSLDASGGLFLNHAPVSLAALPAQLAAARGRLKDPVVVINADRAVSHGAVVSVLDVVRQTGLQRVSFQVETVNR
ncbi:MAG: biopolymer transporter ExbD [Candidatus Omnitrophica bacterium]|nr:biopolymer transporter ExbD [Candidatus Omnitrophota bacterium]